MRYLYANQLLFVDKYFQKAEWMAYHPFKFEGKCHLKRLWNTDVWWIVMHVDIFRWFEEWPFDYINGRLFIGRIRFLKVRYDSCMLKKLKIFVLLAVKLSGFVSIVASISDVAASILLPTLFLVIMFSRH